MKNYKIIALHILTVTSLTSLYANSPAEVYNDNYNKPVHKKLQPYSNPFKRKKKPKKYDENSTKIFTPDVRFGGDAAQGTYNPKDQTAMITQTNGEKINFTQMVAQPTNPKLLDKKNLDKNTIPVGSFTGKDTSAGMPRVIYLFGVSDQPVATTPLAMKPFKKSKKRMSPGPVVSPTNQSTKKNMPGSNPATYAPVAFSPDDDFKGSGLVGNYFKATQTATIHDPSGKNKTSYTFEQVQEGGAEQPDGLVLIGKLGSQPKCNSGICSHAIMITNLYGVVKETQNQNTNSDQATATDANDDQSNDTNANYANIVDQSDLPVDASDENDEF